MADQDFNIKVVTTADTSGLRQTSAEIDEVQKKAAKTTPVNVVPPVVPPVAAEPERFALQAATQQRTIEAEISAIAQSRLALAQARNAGDKEEVAILQNELRVRTAILGVLRAETLTQAELIALTDSEAIALTAGATARKGAAAEGLLSGVNLSKARQEATYLARELATGVPTTRTLSSLLGALGPGILVAVGAGFALNRAIAANAERELQVNQELSKQIEKVTELSGKWTELAHSVTGPEDILKLTGAIIPALDEAQTKFREFQNTNAIVSNWKAALDFITAGIPGVGKAFEESFKTQAAVLAENVQRLRETATAAARVGEETEAAFDKKKAEPLGQAITELDSKLREHQKLQKQIGVANIESYTAEGKIIQTTGEQLTKLIAIQKQRSEFAAINTEGLSEEESKQAAIERTLEQNETILRAMGVDARDLNAAYAEGERRAGAQGEAIRRAASEIAKARQQAQQEAQAEASKLGEDIRISPEQFGKQQFEAAFKHETDRAALEQKRREAVAIGDEERAKSIEEDLRSNRFDRDQRKEALQRYVANQESIGAEVADAAASRRKIGDEGQRKYEDALGELANIYRAEKLEREKKLAPETDPRFKERLAGVGEDPTIVHQLEVERIRALRQAEAQQPSPEKPPPEKPPPEKPPAQQQQQSAQASEQTAKAISGAITSSLGGPINAMTGVLQQILAEFR